MSEDLRLLEFDYEDKKISVYIKNPSGKDNSEAQYTKAITLQEGMQRKLYLRQQMHQELKKRGLIDDETQEKIDSLRKKLREKLEALNAGGIRISEARELALEISDLRSEIVLTTSPMQDFANGTADGLADQAELDYLISACVVYNDDRNKKYFKDYQDYLDRKFNPDAYIIARRFAEVLYDTVFDDTRLPENEFLKKAGFVNEKLQFINKDGHLTNRKGELLNENGERIEYIDGVAVVIEEKTSKPFLDDDGNPIEI